MERRFLSAVVAPVTVRAEGDSQRIGGYAAVYFDGTAQTEFELWDFRTERAVERLMPGCFTKALARPDDVRSVFNHDPNYLLGRTTAGTMKLNADGRGLLYEVTPPNTTAGRDVVESIKRKDVTGSSFAFISDEERWTETKDETGKWSVVREILSVTLFDASPVVFPAYEGTSAGMRKAGDVDDARSSLEKFRQTRKAEADEAAKAIAAQLEMMNATIRVAQIRAAI